MNYYQFRNGDIHSWIAMGYRCQQVCDRATDINQR